MNVLCKDIDGNVLKAFYQWDLGKKVVFVGVESANTVHFDLSNDQFGKSYEANYSKDDGEYIVDIPDVLLRNHSPIWFNIYEEIDENHINTLCIICIQVIPRAKPLGYISEDTSSYQSYQKLRNDVDYLLDKLTEVTEIPKSINVVKSNNQITITTTYNNDNVTSDLITLDGNGYPSAISTKGIECVLTWEGV